MKEHLTSTSFKLEHARKHVVKRKMLSYVHLADRSIDWPKLERLPRFRRSYCIG